MNENNNKNTIEDLKSIAKGTGMMLKDKFKTEFKEELEDLNRKEEIPVEKKQKTRTILAFVCFFLGILLLAFNTSMSGNAIASILLTGSIGFMLLFCKELEDKRYLYAVLAIFVINIVLAMNTWHMYSQVQQLVDGYNNAINSWSSLFGN